MWERGRRGDSGHIAWRVAGSFKRSRRVLVVASCSSAALQLWQRGPVGPGRPGRRGSWASSRARHPDPSQGGRGLRPDGPRPPRGFPDVGEEDSSGARGTHADLGNSVRMYARYVALIHATCAQMLCAIRRHWA